MTGHAIKPLDGDDDLAAGSRLGPYQIVGPLGAGGMGRVYRAVDTRLGREVAVKVLEPGAAAAPGRRRRFDREARLASAVNHPHVLTIFDVGEWDGRACVVSELLEGQTLRAHLRPGLLGAQQAVGYAVQVCRGLEALHARGIVHRDLKPENVFVTTDGWVKILDLGLAAPVRDADGGDPEPWDALTTEGGAAGGTAAYMSPEQVRRLRVDPRSDIFACGVVLYEMLARRRPFQEETAAETMTAVLRRAARPLREIDPSLPRALVRVVERCLEKRPEDRFHSAHDLALALEASLDSPPPPSTTPRAIQPPARALPPAIAAAARNGFSRVVATVSLLLALTSLPWWLNWPARVPLLHASRAPALSRYDATDKRFAPFLEGIAAHQVDASRDGTWIAYTTYPDGELWRARAGGSERRRLTEPPLQAALPRWSPDGTRIAFAGKAPGRPWQVHIVSASGGPVEILPPENVTDPGWTADGTAILLGPVSGTPAAIVRWDLASGRQTLVAGSYGLFSPRPSPDGRYLAALTDGAYELRLLDLASGEWAKLDAGPVNYPAWTRDGAWLHFRRDEGDGSSFYRIDPATRRLEPVAAVGELALASGEWGAWSGLSPDGAPLVLLAADDAAADPRPDQGAGAVRVESREAAARKTSR
jgi:serine/threonine protein kinase